MKKMLPLIRLSSLAAALLLSAQAMADTASLDVTFTATLKETTCDMQIEGGSGDGSYNVIPIGSGEKVSLADITSGSDAATATFKLKIVECPDSLATLKTTVSGSKSGYVETGIVNGRATGAADYIALTIARADAPDAPFVINSTDDSKRLVWTGDEIAAKEVPLIARIIETKSGLGTTGAFDVVATFNFTYE